MPDWMIGPPDEPEQKPPAADIGPPAPVIDPDPWIDIVIPPEEVKEDPPEETPDVVIEPVEVPPVVIPPPPDMTPPTIVPPEVEDPAPVPVPNPPSPEDPGGGSSPPKPPPTVIVLGPGSVIGTFMVYVGSKLVLSMAASAGTQGGKELTKMLVGALNKRMRRGTSVRFNTGNSPGTRGDYWEGRRAAAVGVSDAWRQLPQEFSYWEA